MKMMHVAAAAFMVLSGSALTSSAFAQAACAAMPPAPTVPDGAVAKQGEMTLANRKFTEWSTSVKTTLDCERAAVDAMKSNPNVVGYTEAVAKLKATQDTPDVKAYTEKVASYNGLANEANKVSEQWKAAVETYNGRQKK